MKKMIAAVALGTLLVGGFLFTQDNQPTDLATGESEPSVFSKMSLTSLKF
ncbi:hypothetical protein SAMN05216389_11077 [Oceanobacillus limi]|uniref:Phr family secreted Rap phosphatase inhibitor n=1 Tax=Oceanobacillus limi TaxID=930131 RepID=A0A1I0E390_9BACI|nr:hypothetical protein [Oceanobacillus limi]SET39206.1 hypothetical protein SAMN05216389_11077 [Oceanobacillus limi]